MESLHINEAQELLERAYVKYPNDVNVLDALGELLFSLGETERAISVCCCLAILAQYVMNITIVAQAFDRAGTKRKWPQVS